MLALIKYSMQDNNGGGQVAKKQKAKQNIDVPVFSMKTH